MGMMRTEKWFVTYFAPDGDHRQPRDSEASARRFAARDDVLPWNPIIEHVVTVTTSTIIYHHVCDGLDVPLVRMQGERRRIATPFLDSLPPEERAKFRRPDHDFDVATGRPLGPEPITRRVATRGDEKIRGVALVSDLNGPFHLRFRIDGIMEPIMLNTREWTVEFEEEHHG